MDYLNILEKWFLDYHKWIATNTNWLISDWHLPEWMWSSMAQSRKSAKNAWRNKIDIKWIEIKIKHLVCTKPGCIYYDERMRKKQKQRRWRLKRRAYQYIFLFSFSCFSRCFRSQFLFSIVYFMDSISFTFTKYKYRVYVRTLLWLNIQVCVCVQMCLTSFNRIKCWVFALALGAHTQVMRSQCGLYWHVNIASPCSYIQ